MSQTTPILDLPLIQASQAQKHVTHNESLVALDALVQPVAQDRDRTSPPALPAEGDVHVVATDATDDWLGHDGALAHFSGGGWVFHAPRAGWRVQVLAEDIQLLFDDTGWAHDTGAATRPTLGVNTTADAINRLAVAAPATLLTHAGGGHQVKVNKATPGDTGSLLFQTNWSGRAEMGCSENDDFSIKISPDGAAWTTALRFDASTGSASGAAIQATPVDASADRLLSVGAFGLGTPHRIASGVPIHLQALEPGFYTYRADQVPSAPETLAYLHALFVTRADNANGGRRSYFVIRAAGNTSIRAWLGTDISDGSGIYWTGLLHGANTIVDANGFLKQASPIVRLYADRTEEPLEPVGAIFRRAGLGHYILTGTPPLAEDGWTTQAAVNQTLQTLRVGEDLHVFTSEGQAPSDIPAEGFALLRFREAVQNGGSQVPAGPVATVADLQAHLDLRWRRIVDAERDRRLETDVIARLEGFGAISVRGRDRDLNALLSLRMAAGAGDVSEGPLLFRDACDVVHTMTPAQIRDLGQQVQSCVQRIYQAAWILKETEAHACDVTDDIHWPVA